MYNQFKPTSYKLQSVKSGEIFEDNGQWLLDPPNEETNTLIRTIYAKKCISVGDNSLGIFKFADWLPAEHFIEESHAPITYKSSKLAHAIGLSNLWVTFNGYYPEIGGNMTTCSFKETEAYSVCARLTKQKNKILVVASAGNTARAFAKVCSKNNIKLLLCVPEDNINALWFDEPLNNCVKLITTEQGSDYFDAIELSNIVVKNNVYLAEGGAKNVARRDGMGTTVLSAATTIGQIPDYYFQAVGSGTGAIAAWEANMRLIEDGHYGNNKMKLIVSQNEPFIPIYRAFHANSKTLLHYDNDDARNDAHKIIAKVLSNRKPPYSIIGGLYDAIKYSNGTVEKISNDEILAAKELFYTHEGIDIYSAPSAALASLIKSIKNQSIDKNKIIMLNITGGGEKLFFQNHKLHYLKPTLSFKINTPEDFILNKLEILNWE